MCNSGSLGTCQKGMCVMNNIKVDFSKNTGEIKPLHGVCCAPYVRSAGPNQAQIDKYFKEAKIPYCRLHDCCGPYGGTYYVDVPNIFRDFDADENDEANYDFHYTDEYVKAIQDSGCEAYYRLGVTIEWGSKKYTSMPPSDFAKWARICEHIIMHYNKGWANGFEFNIKYWEIWNEPENPGSDLGKCQWGGTKEEFFDLYRTASLHLRKCFPEIKIGGYGGCGFYAITRDDIPESHKEFVTYFTDFLEMVSKENLPLDFYSWHIYTGDELELLAHAKYVRETLDKYGLKDTESHLNEWNIHAEGRGFTSKHTLEGASFNAAVLSMLQNTNYIDMAMYYCFSSAARYNGFINQNDGTIDPPWYSYVAFGELYGLKNAASVEVEGEHIYVSAAIDGDKAAVLISNYKNEDSEIALDLKAVPENSTVHVLRIREGENLEEDFTFTASGDTKIKLKVPVWTVAMLKIEK